MWNILMADPDRLVFVVCMLGVLPLVLINMMY